jgi:hypothetical protein
VPVPDDVAAFLAESHPDAAGLALWVRSAVLAGEPDLTERVYRGWNGIGFHHPEGGYVCAIYPGGDEVRLLFEHGVRLADPDGLLQGDGRQTRSILVREPGDELAASIAAYVRAAVAERLFRR